MSAERKADMPYECRCISYNQPQPGQTERDIILDPRPLFEHTTKTVCVDACIAENVMDLWRAGVWTRYSCCGHGHDYPSVFIDRPEDAVKAYDVLSKDGRQWRIMIYTEENVL